MLETRLGLAFLYTCNHTVSSSILKKDLLTKSRMVASVEEFADVMLKTGDIEREKTFRDIALRAPSQSAAGAALRCSKMVVVAQRRN